MKQVNALQLRRSLSKIIAAIERTGEPILLEKGRKPVAVIISLEDFKKRFVDKDADERRQQLRTAILKMARPSSVKISSEDLLRSMREGDP